MSQLILYRAAAGAGKTHTLVSHYIQLALKSPQHFKHILAVTFTNQATQEIKQRILTYLYGLAQGLPSPLATALMHAQGWSMPVLQKRAQAVFTHLLHAYDHFSVRTIDSFFQTIIQSFTKELGLQHGFKLEIAQNEVLTKVIQDLLATASQDPQLKDWLVAFAEDKLLRGKNWDMQKELTALGYELFSEAFSIQEATLLRAIQDPRTFQVFLQQLQQTITYVETHFQALGKAAYKALQQADLRITDFAYGQRGVLGYLMGLQNTKAFKPTQRAKLALTNLAAWYVHTSPKQPQIRRLVQKKLQSILADAIHFYQEHHQPYHTALAVRHFIYAFGLITQLLAKLNHYREENNVMFMTDAAIFLRKIIAEDEVPFVYEKIGTYYHHFLIDEFQDMSACQWENFKPLLTNSLAQGHQSLIVGDVKQAIYRWRGSTWKLLLHQVAAAIDCTTIRYLKHNWRSKPYIVYFNNTFFTTAATVLRKQLQKNIATLTDKTLQKELYVQLQQLSIAYQAVTQELPPQPPTPEPGYIQVSFLATKDTTHKKRLCWKEQVKQRLPLLIERLQHDGYNLKDMALLVRNNAEAREIAQTLLAYQQSPQAKTNCNYDFIAAEALYLGHMPPINLLINALRYLVDEKNLLAKAELIYLYQRFFHQQTPLLHHYRTATTPDHANSSLTTLLPQALLAKKRWLQQLPLYECVEALIRIFHPYCTQAPALMQAFQELIHAFTSKEAAAIQPFLAWWDENGKKTTLPPMETKDAMKIMTIHQAKGLQFNVVILPFCAWDFDHLPQQPPILWCRTQTPPFATFPALPLRYTKQLKDTVYVSNYYEEQLQIYLDNLNLLYVAFTRPKERLYVFAPKPSQETLKTTAELLYHTFTQPQNKLAHDPNHPAHTVLWERYWNPSQSTLVIGKETAIEASPTTTDQNQPSLQPYLTHDWYHQRTMQTKLLQGNQLTDSQALKRHYGRHVKHLLAQIKHRQELDEALATLQKDVGLSQAGVTYLSQQIRRLWHHHTVKNWFDGTWTLGNANTMLMPVGNVVRPGRVMTKTDETVVLDFKTEEKNVQHERQMKIYASLLSAMGYPRVKAYVLYLTTYELVVC